MRDADNQTLLIGCGSASATHATPEAHGFKAYNLWRMERIGLPVPAAFVLDTGFCRDFFRDNRQAPPNLKDLLSRRMRDLERASGLVFGGARRPLLVSVRSGAPVSMPGMMDTVLDIGLCDAAVPGLLRLTGNPRLVWDSYRRLIQSYAEVVCRLPGDRFDAALEARIAASTASSIADLDFQALRALTHDFIEIFEQLAGTAFPQQPAEQLHEAIVAVWASWAGERAVEYRRLRGVSDTLGTAVTVQQMVFGNAGGASGAGVAFTRDPASGEPELYLDFMFNAQGEDVVSGRRSAPDPGRLANVLPQVHAEIAGVARRLEAEFRDMQEFEFTVQDGRLFVLQTRTGKRMPWSALRIAVDMVAEGCIGRDEALERLKAVDLEGIKRLKVSRGNNVRVLCRAVSAGIGVATGEIVLDSEGASAVAAAGRSAILVRELTSTDDIAGIAAAAGILTATGGRTSHAAVVARQLDKVCIVGCDALSVDLDHRRCSIAGHSLAEGEVITLDGHSGDVLSGVVTVEAERPVDLLGQVAAWRQVVAA
jgi:pyruvate,orthophosphate dikinase